MSGIDAVLRMERVRLSTLRSSWIVLGLAVAVSAAVSTLVAIALRREQLDTDAAAVLLTSGGGFVPLPFAAVFLGVLGVLAVGHDYRHGLVRPVLAAVPSRTTVLVARLTVLGIVAAVASALCIGAGAAIGYGVLRQWPPATWELARALAGYLLLAVLWTWLGAGATWLLRSTAAVLTLLLTVPLVVEPLLHGISGLPALSWLVPVVRWLPFTAGRVMVLTGGSMDQAGADITPIQGGLVFGGLVAGVLVAGWLCLLLRDA